MNTKILQALFLFLAGIACVMLSNLANYYWGIWQGSDPFYFPAAFVLAMLYGWWGRNYIAAFLVGFLAIPYMLPIQMNPWPHYATGSVLHSLWTLVSGTGRVNLLELEALAAFGAAAGLCGMGMVKLARWRQSSRA